MAAVTTELRRNLRGGWWRIAEVILLVLAVIGLAAWVYQLVKGLAITNMTDLVPWGIYLTMFMFMVGLSAGGLIVASSGEVFGVEKLKPLAPLAIWLSFVCVGLAAVFVLPDLGSIQNIWRMITGPNWSSPLIWDIIIITVYLVLSAVYLWLHSKAGASGAEGAKYKTYVHRLAFVALPAAILIHSITAWIFGLQASRSFWHSALLAPFFITSALVSGLALMILATFLARKNGIVKVSNSVMSWLGGLLAVFIIVDLFLLLAELLTRFWPGDPEVFAAREIVLGRYSGLFWLEVLCGVAAFLMLALRDWRKNMSVVGWAAVLAIVGILLKRFNLMMAGFVQPYSALPENIRAAQALPDVSGPSYVWVLNAGPFQLSFPYTPALVEIVIVIGLVAAAALVWLIGLQIFNMKAHAAED